MAYAIVIFTMDQYLLAMVIGSIIGNVAAYR
jgi:hypothetical protein